MRRMRSIATAWALILLMAAGGHAATTFTDTDPYGITYSVTVSLLSGSNYHVSVTINTSGYAGSHNAWLDWFNLKISPANPASVSGFTLPGGWSYAGTSAGKVEVQSAVVGPPGASPDATDIGVPIGGGPVINLSYKVDLTGTSLKTDVWPYQARYIFASGRNGHYTQTIVSRELVPTAAAIPEPTALMLFGLGLAAPLVARRRTR